MCEIVFSLQVQRVFLSAKLNIAEQVASLVAMQL
jgi:hypothetical protein